MSRVQAVRAGTTATAPDWWASGHFDFQDELNDEIWGESPSLGARLAQDYPHEHVGVWQDRWAPRPVPWVPDLVGRRWREPRGILVLGGAYAPFVEGAASRNATMSWQHYDIADSAPAFGSHFLEHVVRADRDYYGVVQALLDGLVAPDEMALGDLVRGSFVHRDANGRFSSSEAKLAGKDEKVIFSAYATAGWRWTHARAIGAGSRIVLALGDRAMREFAVLAGASVTAGPVGHPGLARKCRTLESARGRGLLIQAVHPGGKQYGYFPTQFEESRALLAWALAHQRLSSCQRA